MKLSLLCIVNNQKIYQGFLESLKLQKFTDYELITIMNMNGEYDGARAAFNQNGAVAKGEYLMFIHPDIRFLKDTSLGDIALALDENMPFGVLGAAGAKPDGKGGREIVTTILQGEDKSPVGRRISGPEEVQTLDECLFIVKKSYFDSHPFSEKKGWHLYGTEYCLDAIADGLVNKVIPSDIWHMSAGNSLNESYMVQLEELIEEKKDNFELICTTVKAWKSKGRKAKIYRKYYYFKQLIKRKMGIGI